MSFEACHRKNQWDHLDLWSQWTWEGHLPRWLLSLLKNSNVVGGSRNIIQWRLKKFIYSWTKSSLTTLTPIEWTLTDFIKPEGEKAKDRACMTASARSCNFDDRKTKTVVGRDNSKSKTKDMDFCVTTIIPACLPKIAFHNIYKNVIQIKSYSQPSLSGSSLWGDT